MKSLLALMRKEYMEATRTGKIMIIILLFVLFGIMSPAVAKLTPWMMKMLSDSMAESGLIVTNVQVDALTSWTQFFKNIPIALIAFVLICHDIKLYLQKLCCCCQFGQLDMRYVLPLLMDTMSIFGITVLRITYFFQQLCGGYLACGLYALLLYFHHC